MQALRLTGASRPAVLLLGVLPQARPGLLSLLLYQLECNVRTATVLGIVGAGGLGQAIDLSLRLFDYGQLGTLLVTVLVLVLGVDAVSPDGCAPAVAPTPARPWPERGRAHRPALRPVRRRPGSW